LRSIGTDTVLGLRVMVFTLARITAASTWPPSSTSSGGCGSDCTKRVASYTRYPTTTGWRA